MPLYVLLVYRVFPNRVIMCRIVSLGGTRRSARIPRKGKKDSLPASDNIWTVRIVGYKYRSWEIERAGFLSSVFGLEIAFHGLSTCLCQFRSTVPLREILGLGLEVSRHVATGVEKKRLAVIFDHRPEDTRINSRLAVLLSRLGLVPLFLFDTLFLSSGRVPILLVQRLAHRRPDSSSFEMVLFLEGSDLFREDFQRNEVDEGCPFLFVTNLLTVSCDRFSRVLASRA